MKKCFLLLTLFCTLSFLSSTAKAVFRDVASNYPYKTAIEALQKDGIVQGYADGTFKPDQAINRAEFLKIVMTAAQKGTTSGNCFTDVQNQWFAKYVCQAKFLGVAKGYPDGKFHPEKQINQVEAWKIIYLSNGISGNTTAQSHWYSPYYEDAQANNLLINSWTVDKLMSRGEMAEMIWRFKLKYLTAANLENMTNSTQTNSTGETGHASNSSSVNSDAPSDLYISPLNQDDTLKNEVLTKTNSLDDYFPGYKLSKSKVNNTADPSNSIYVQASGATGGDGTIDRPYNSIQEAVDQAESGQTIVLLRGTYNLSEEIDIEKPNLTFKSKQGEWAIVKLSEKSEDAVFNLDVGSDGTVIDGLEVVGGFYGIATQTKWDWGEDDRSGASNIIIKNSVIHGSGRDAIKIKPNSDGVIIKNNEIFDTGKTESADDCNAEGIDNVNADKMLVEGNYIHNICSTGVYCKGGAQNCVIKNNYITNTGEAGLILGGDTSVDYFDLKENPNWFENINGQAVGNLIVNTGSGGIEFWAAKSPIVEKNTIINSAQKYHSPVYFNISLQDWEDVAGRPASENVTFQKNLIWQPNNAKTGNLMVAIRVMDELGGLIGLKGWPKMSDNCYFQEDNNSVTFKDNRQSDKDISLEQWQKNSAADSDSVNLDPKLNDLFQPNNKSCSKSGYQLHF